MTDTQAQVLEVAVDVAPAIPALVRGGSTYLAKRGMFGKAAATAATEARLGSAACATTAVRKVPFVGMSNSQARRRFQKTIVNDPDHLLKCLLNDKGKFFKTRGLSHAELLDNPLLVQMGHSTTRASGAPERLILQGAYENQLQALTIERASIGGFVEQNAIDIGGIAVDISTAEKLERFGFLPAGTVESAPVIKLTGYLETEAVQEEMFRRTALRFGRHYMGK